MKVSVRCIGIEVILILAWRWNLEISWRRALRGVTWLSFGVFLEFGCHLLRGDMNSDFLAFYEITIPAWQKTRVFPQWWLAIRQQRLHC